jgi:hypothetical protein
MGDNGNLKGFDLVVTNGIVVSLNYDYFAVKVYSEGS